MTALTYLNGTTSTALPETGGNFSFYSTRIRLAANARVSPLMPTPNNSTKPANPSSKQNRPNKVLRSFVRGKFQRQHGDEKRLRAANYPCQSG